MLVNTASITRWKSDPYELVNELRLRNEKAFEYLFDSYSAALLHCIRKIAGPSHSEDLLQNAFIKIWHNFASYNPEKASLFTWMQSITHNEAVDYLRSKQSRKQLLTTTLTPEQDNRHDRSFLESARFDLSKSLSTFPTKERVIIELYNRGYTCQEIGTLLDTPEGTVKTKMRAIYKRLRIIHSN